LTTRENDKLSFAFRNFLHLIVTSYIYTEMSFSVHRSFKLAQITQ